MTTAILADFPVVSGHFSRIEVAGSTDAYNDDYDWDGMMRAAELLSHAEPDVICWNGSKGGSIGLDADRRLCERITAATGKPATTSSLAILEAFAAIGVSRPIILGARPDLGHGALCFPRSNDRDRATHVRARSAGRCGAVRDAAPGR